MANDVTSFGPIYPGGKLPSQPDWSQFMLDDPTRSGIGFDVKKFARALTLLQYGGLANQLKSNIGQEGKYAKAIPASVAKAYAQLNADMGGSEAGINRVTGSNAAANTGLANSLGALIGGNAGSGAGAAFGANAQNLNNQNNAMAALMKQANFDSNKHYNFEKGAQQNSMVAQSQGRMADLLNQQKQARSDSSAAYTKNLMDLMQAKQQGMGNAINIAGNLQNQNLAQALGADQLAVSGLNRTQMEDQIRANRVNQHWQDLSNAQNYAQGQEALKQIKGENKNKPLVWHKLSLDQQDAAMQNATRGIWQLDPSTNAPKIGPNGAPILKRGLDETVNSILASFKGTVKITPGLKNYVRNWISQYDGGAGQSQQTMDTINDPSSALFGPYSQPLFP